MRGAPAKERQDARGPIQLFEVAVPLHALELLYEVLGHFPHESGSWQNVARAQCSLGLHEARALADLAEGKSASQDGVE